MPATGSFIDDNLDTTVWARVSTQQVVVNAFDNDPNARVNQDVGLDGWNNIDESIHYSNYVNWVQNNTILDPTAKARMISDPSNDDYNYYRDDVYDTQQLNILERYKKYNGMEGNSPTTEMSNVANADGYPTLGTNSPDVEDVNQDNNLSETESYFQYKVSLRPNEMQVGQNFITDVQTYDKGNGELEKWYQLKIPIRDFEKKINGINDFRSIRFMRMFMKDFNEEVVLRFARLEFIRGEWRRFYDDLTEPGEGIVVDPNLTTFNVGAVNIQENDKRVPIEYKVPPGITQEVDPSQTFQRLLNEQSLTLEVCDLQDGDARAAYRNVQFDVRAYKKLKMFVHAEEVDPLKALDDDDITLFVRLGTDFTDNYYEYELPLKTSAWGASTDTDIWPEENFMEIVFEDLLNLKKGRNELINSGSLSASYVVEYSKVDPANAERIIKVKGSYTGEFLKLMLEEKLKYNSGSSGNLVPKCAIVWLTGGWGTSVCKEVMLQTQELMQG